MEIRSIDGSFAREVVGLETWHGLTPDQIAELRAAWADCGVLVFRRQSLSEPELVQLSDSFGKTQVVHRTDWVSAEYPKVILVSNLQDVTGKHVGMPGSDDVEWHTDQSYVVNPATGAMLYAVEIPNDGGGTTCWTNLRVAYDELPADLKREAEGKRAVFSYLKRLEGYSESARNVSEEMKKKTPDVLHPIVNSHPVTGKKSLFLDPGTTTGIESMAESEGMALLQKLAAASTQPHQVYRHRWQVGDVVLWDNGFCLHRRDHYESTQRRFLKRTTIALPAEHHIVPVGEVRAAAVAA